MAADILEIDSSSPHGERHSAEGELSSRSAPADDSSQATGRAALRGSIADGGPTPTAFEPLLASIIDSAFGMALRLTRNRADAEDLVQEAALLAFRGFASFEPGSNFKAWFFRILSKCYYVSYRKQRRRPSTVDFDDTPDLYLYKRASEEGISRPAPDPVAALFSKLDTERVTVALEQLPEEYRVVSTLYFMEDLSYQQIAEILGCPVGTVRSRLHRGRKMLQKALWQVAEECGVISKLAGARGQA